MKFRNQARADESSKAASMLMSARMLGQLRHQDVSRATRRIAKLLGREFAVSAYRLADIESGRVTPTLFRLSSLCAVYGLEMRQVMQWYGIPPRADLTDSVEAA